MRNRCRGTWLFGAYASMLRSNAAAARILHECGSVAMTDVTGFGLAGHLSEMLGDSLRATIYVDTIPLIDGAQECAKTNIQSSLFKENYKFSR